MEILEAMIGNENTEEEIEQWTENHRAIVVIYDVRIKEIKNIIFTLKIEEKPITLSKKKEEFRGDQKKKEESQKCRWR